MKKHDKYHKEVLYRISDNLKKLRKTKGLTQEQFSELCEFNLRYYQKLESKNYSPSLNTLCRVSNILDTDILSLFEK